jgi:chromosome segregation protein
VFLKSLEIFGFKSFADRTKIEFSEGISALLGPNGCGKSNIVDAIKWVVGEQSPKSLRADSMEDIIFNGTETRKPLSVAEVTITISNEAGTLPLDISEVAIRRRLYRSGESEYYINSQLAKLKEVRELFWDTGIGKSAYSVMEQGKIDQILSSKPEDRRYLFEEAAGITRHKARVREAELRLERTEENMRQIDVVLTEVKRSHDSLKIHAQKTIAYRAAKDSIFQLELDLTLLRLRQFVRERDKREEDFAIKTKERNEIKEQSDALGNSMSENLDVVNGLETRLIELQKILYGLAVDKNGKEKHRSLLSDRRREIGSKIEQLELRSRSIRGKIDSLREEEEDKESELADYKLRLRDAEKNISEFETSIKTSSIAIRSNTETIAKHGASIRDLETLIGRSRSELDNVTGEIVEELDARLKESEYSAVGRSNVEKEIDDIILRIKTKVSGRMDFFTDLNKFGGAARQEASSGEITQTISKIMEDMKELLGLVDTLGLKFEKYRGAVPSFIDDFLSPEGIMTKKRAFDSAIAENGAKMAELGRKISALESENSDLVKKMDTWRKTAEDARLVKAQVEAQLAGAQDALAVFRREIAGQEATLREQEGEIASERSRKTELTDEIIGLDEEITAIEAEGKRLTTEMDALDRDIEIRNSDMVQRKREMARLADIMSATQAELETLQLGVVQIQTEIKNLKENFKEQYSRDLNEFESRMYEIRKPIGEVRDELAVKRGELRDLGSVNLMAPEEYQEVKERYDFLSGQMADLQKARDDLRQITEQIRSESAELFLDSYNKIKKNFHNMFRRLFGGGRAELKLADPDHILESGIEILAQPPGKKLEAISLLSGGEKTLTAIGLLFATYMVKPSPFCFLDEIDAALDEANVIRFVNLLREFGKTSQFIVITHNKKTVSGADTLLGVTMEESGITKAIAVKLERHGSGEASLRITGEVDDFMEEDVEFESGQDLGPLESTPL